MTGLEHATDSTLRRVRDSLGDLSLTTVEGLAVSDIYRLLVRVGCEMASRHDPLCFCELCMGLQRRRVTQVQA